MTIYSRFSDLELTSFLVKGDHTAYEEIYNRYNALLYIHAYKKLHNREQAQDIVQEVFVTLWAKHKELLDIANMGGFLYTCIYHKILDLITHQNINEKHISQLSTYRRSENSNTDFLVRERQLTVIIEREIKELPPKMREVFELSRFRHMSHKQIAEQLDVSEETVKKQVKNALKILRTKLGLFVYLIFLLRF
ncbi:RNA polymerase sigma factor [Pedobacter psychroterrae]|uniref:RNA polymerase sigma-70 factor n=1 Tax=Pedobacter psychroterrae TaxID=2530453 RepID=A0A4R0NKW1_9SPHI|nr:RNA polymerase sigma-70 factor [Pedobacter psychroterrae]TCD01381.1 RNA polymerase sigma-70 factor [Pedobacter psychroterrae]